MKPIKKGFVAPRPFVAVPKDQDAAKDPAKENSAAQPVAPTTKGPPLKPPIQSQVKHNVLKTIQPPAKAGAPSLAFRAPQATKPIQAATKPTQTQAADTEYKVVLYIKKYLFWKKMKTKVYSDGILCLPAEGPSTLHSLDTGKVVTTGKAKRATAKDLEPPGSKGSWGGKGKGKKQQEEEEEEEEDDNDIVRYLLGTLVVEVQSDLPAESFRSGACFTRGTTVYGAVTTTLHSTTSKAGPSKAFKPVGPRGEDGGVRARAAPKGMHDPDAPGAVVLNRAEWVAGMQGTGPAVAAVVVDPYLGRHLRPHQVEGVQFMYDCVMGKRSPGVMGCVLADEMGLGKTLQVLTLVWTLLRQGPAGKPLAGKVLVVTPATLCGNWDKEAKQWLGKERLQVFMLGQQQDAAERVQQFKHGLVERLCITSYETLRKHSQALAGAFDMVVCDEGHRLKAVGGSKTTEALLQLGCNRRVLLTGTPIQNNLEEFYALVNFVAPELLGSPSAFRKVYAEPVARAQERDATPEAKELGASRAGEMTRKAEAVLLRRTQAILCKHLPPLTNYVLFCKPTQTQVQVYQAILKKVLAALQTSGGGDITLGAITALSKVCNHPGLLSANDAEEEDEPAAKRPKAGTAAGAAAAAAAAAAGQQQQGAAAAAGPSGWVPADMCLDADNSAASGKMAVLRVLTERIISGGERLVVVSTFTAALDAVQRLVTGPLGLSTVRIDGSTTVDDRQSIVDSFNCRGVGQVFMLSTRAGGAGLNLIGASHLVLFSSDWNPAADQQAMARIWRDGQKRPCHVWRLLTTGTIEEKVYQRQIMKGNLALATLANGDGGGATKNARQFTRDELRALFVLTSNTACETRDLLIASSAMQPCVRWLVEGATAAEGVSNLPPGSSLALQAAMASGCLSAASVALKSDEVEQAIAGPCEEDEEEQEGAPNAIPPTTTSGTHPNPPATRPAPPVTHSNPPATRPTPAAARPAPPATRPGPPATRPAPPPSTLQAPQRPAGLQAGALSSGRAMPGQVHGVDDAAELEDGDVDMAAVAAGSGGGVGAKRSRRLCVVNDSEEEEEEEEED